MGQPVVPGLALSVPAVVPQAVLFAVGGEAG
jgi:hypothetical protein